MVVILDVNSESFVPHWRLVTTHVCLGLPLPRLIKVFLQHYVGVHLACKIRVDADLCALDGDLQLPGFNGEPLGSSRLSLHFGLSFSFDLCRCRLSISLYFGLFEGFELGSCLDLCFLCGIGFGCLLS